MKTYHLYIGFILLNLLSVASWGQSIATLEKKANDLNNHDTVRINALQKWDEQIYLTDPDLDQGLNEQIIAIAEPNISKTDLTVEELYFYQNALLSAYNIVGINLDTKGYYFQALNSYYEAIKYARLLEDREREGAISNNIGLVHELQGNVEKAIEFYAIAEEVALEFSDTIGIISAKNNLASSFSTQNKFEESKVGYVDAIRYARAANYRGQLASSLQNLGVLFEVQDQFDSALYYYKQCLDICEEDQSYWEEHSKVLYNIGSIYNQRTDLPIDSAIYFCDRGLKIASEFDGRYTMLHCAKCLYASYKLNAKTDSALYYLEYMDDLQDSLTNKETTILIAQKESQFEYQQKAAADSIQNLEKDKLQRAELAAETAEKDKQKQRSYYLIGGLVLLAIFGLIIYRRLQITKKQKEVITLQKKESDKQKEIIASQHEEISDSINYAEMIQQSVLPQLNIDQLHPESFVIFKPKDKVSGDFYWLEQNDNFKYFCVADCTGHGIPGAFISMIGTILLNEIYNSKQLTSPNEILDELNRLVKLTLTNRYGHTMKDGMDIAMIAVNESQKELIYSGANNPLWIVRKNEHILESKLKERGTVKGENYSLIEFKATKQPVGHYSGDPRPFEEIRTVIYPSDTLYLFSDGYPDQFGGPKGKKFKYRSFKELLLANQDESMSKQKEIIVDTFDKWKGNFEQVDDVCVIGVRI